ncbi:hypothetical protein Q4610_20050 [Sphingobium sp. HBC34]|uniref:Uncharacterized protein n=1 Tax=Sphingobium cyanobacteriorum TaxID=3063954 RepID=A0ABT8ZS31_9SPHN|nr:hypothetical protein [Sphingobium sp. HBC34]MDO7837342.1 hypothetical protein [Sphingobium sp. HBC34]
MKPRTYLFTWQGIEIEAIYEPLKWKVTAHLEIRSISPAGARLPITDTGYRSHFHRPGTIEAEGGNVVAQVIAWLDEAAATDTDWTAYVKASRQGDLFK